MEMRGLTGGGDDGGVGGSFWPPPAFLSKTFQIVNDPETNHIVSWGKSGDSFVIWDHNQFSVEILPNYFRHNNFSSFVYQLNNYGFRKIGVDHQWEYANPNFQAGKEHLLSSMRRRSMENSTLRRHRKSSCLFPEIQLRSAIEESKKEIRELKMQQALLDSNIKKLQQESSEFKAISKRLLMQWAKACDHLITAKEKETGSVLDLVHVDGGGDEGAGEIPLQESGKHEENAITSEDMNDWIKIMLGDDDGVMEVEPNKHAKIASDFQELIARVDDDFSLEMDFADANYSPEKKNVDASSSSEMKIGFQELLTNEGDEKLNSLVFTIE